MSACKYESSIYDTDKCPIKRTAEYAGLRSFVNFLGHEQNRLQLAEFAKENAQLQAEVSATKARAIKLDNYTRRENIRLLNVPESQDENCKEILRGVMAAVKMQGADKVEFHAVHRIGNYN